MRVLFVSHSLPPEGRPMENLGGMQRVAEDLHDSLLQRRDIELRTLVLRSGWNERAYRTPIFLARALREIRRMARAREIDAILFSSIVTATLVVPLQRLLKRSKVATAAIVNGLDATTQTWPYPILVRRTFEALDRVLPISRATGEVCKDRGLSSNICEVVPLGVRSDGFISNFDPGVAREKILKGRNARLILCSVGRLVPRKGVAWFIANVMPLLPDDVLYLVAGDGPDKPRIASSIAQYGLKDNVELLGQISNEELETLYNGADLFIMPNIPVPNDIEGFGLVMLEAGMCGLPVIASNLEGIADVIAEGANGHLVETGGDEGFQVAIMRYYSDLDALRALKTRTRIFTSSQFSWDAVVDRYISILQSLSS
jgi:phosphatidylinositol alpha-1,6-mannosyltransferase